MGFAEVTVNRTLTFAGEHPLHLFFDRIDRFIEISRFNDIHTGIVLPKTLLFLSVHVARLASNV
jgi:hypothetical protein